MNEEIFYFFYSFSHINFFIDKIIILLAKYLPYLTVVLSGVFLLMHHEIFGSETPVKVFLQKKKEIFQVFFVSILAWFISFGLKFLLAFKRPVDVLNDIFPLFTKNDYSFPSGHASFFGALAFSIYLFHKKAGFIFFVLTLIIGVSRIIAGVHFPIDILAGLSLGIGVAYFLKKF